MMDTLTDSQPLSMGADAVPRFALLNRDVIELWMDLWVGMSDQVVRGGVERREIVIRTVRETFGASGVPSAALVWNWWAGAAAGLPGACLQALSMGATRRATATTIGPESTIVVDLTDTVQVDLTAQEAMAATGVDAPTTTPSITADTTGSATPSRRRRHP